MRALRRFLMRFARSITKRDEDRLREEVEGHLALQTEENVRAGMAPVEARRQARLKFGPVEAVKEEYRDAQRLPPLDSLGQDVRYALRQLRRAPSFTLAVTLTLALGLGANTAIFSLLDQVLLRTLPVQKPQELVYLYSEGPWQGSYSSDESGGAPFSYPLFRALQRTQTPFVGLAGARDGDVSLALADQASHGRARFVSGNYFELLGVRPAIGRLLTEDDDHVPGAHPVAVLRYGYWSSRFGADPGVLNQTILVNNVPMTVVGVAQPGFMSERIGRPPAIYVPVTMREALTPDWTGLDDRKNAWLTMFARLKPGVTRERAEVEINAAYRPQVAEDAQHLNLQDQPPDFLERFLARTITVAPGQYGRTGGETEFIRLPLMLLMAMTLLVLLIACANVANLQLARAAARTREVAVRSALGASPRQLVRQSLTESCLLAFAGGSLGLLVAYWIIRAMVAGAPTWTGADAFFSTTIDVRILVFCAGLSLVAAMLFGLYPALRASRIDLISSFKEQGGHVSSAGGSRGFRKALITAQVAVSLLLLITAGLFARTLVNVASVDLGIRADHLMTFSILPKLNGYTDDQAARLHETLTEQLAELPGVTLVSTAEAGALTGNVNRRSITIDGREPSADDINPNYNLIGAGYFRTMGIALVAGREFTDADTASAPPVAIVNEAFVRHFLPGEDSLGREIDGAGRIVGVVKDAKFSTLREVPPPTFYVPLQQAGAWHRLYFYVRTAMAAESAGPFIERTLAALDPSLPIHTMTTMEQQVVESSFGERALSTLTGAFAGLATLLAAIGLFGMLAYAVQGRTREIGIRMALGADARQVRAIVGREVSLVLLLGTLGGVASAAAIGRLVESFLFGLEPWDAFTYGAAVLLIWLVSLVAAAVPARRATSVDPMIALRYE